MATFPPWYSDELVISKIIERYPQRPSPHSFNNMWVPGTRALTETVKHQLLDSLDDNKSPGSPLCYIAPFNRQISVSLFMQSLDARVSQLWSLADLLKKQFESGDCTLFQDVSQESLFDWSPHLVLQGVVDPVLLKVKGEPRLLGKHPRLVCMVSALDNSIARIVLHNAMLVEQEFDDTPTATRIDLTSPEARSARLLEFQSVGTLYGNDVQGWEYANNATTHFWPFLKWAHVLALHDIRDMQPGSSKIQNDHFWLLFAYYVSSLFKVLQLEEGIMVVSKPGIISSGGLPTFTDNSCKRALLEFHAAKLANLEVGYIKTAGDDCLSDQKIDASCYLAYGFVITDQALHEGDDYSFCSTIFGTRGCYQENIEKFFVSLCYSASVNDEIYLREQLVAFEACFSEHPRYAEFGALVVEVYSHTLAGGYRNSA